LYLNYYLCRQGILNFEYFPLNISMLVSYLNISVCEEQMA
jgi:hypothetical protein